MERQPDPDYILGINRCSGLPARVGGPYLSDAYYCNAEYDRLYAQQLAELDTGKRAGIVKEMERILYQDNIFVVWGYADGTVNLRSCGRSTNHISLIRHTRPGEIAEANRRKSPSDCSS